MVEDFGRYIGFGWKEFRSEDNRIYPLMKLIWPTSETCYGLNTEAKILCEHSEAIDSFDIQILRAVYEQLENKESESAILLKEGLDAFEEKFGTMETSNYNAQEFRDNIVALRQYYQAHSIKSDADMVAIPYRYIVPLNIVFNRSLQNLSSYYTDIGFVRVVLFILLIVALPYAIVKRDENLIALSLTTLLGWAIWRVIGSAILWYGTVLISWTAITLLLFVNKLHQNSEESDRGTAVASILVGVVLIVVLAQLFLNFFRISSQGASGPFLWYKGNVGTATVVSENLEGRERVQYGYTATDVFNLQFPQYNAIINALKDRNDEDGVVIAGTYLQYFLHNQRNLQMDGLLTTFWVDASDGDICKTYRRIKEHNTKYLVIDPNIGSVGMGEGNETLFHRFFAKLSPIDGTIDEDGTLTTLVKMYKLGYLELISTNNIGAYYAFTLSDAELQSAFGMMSDEEMVLLRAKLVGIRYFQEEANTLFAQI